MAALIRNLEIERYIYVPLVGRPRQFLFAIGLLATRTRVAACMGFSAIAFKVSRKPKWQWRMK